MRQHFDLQFTIVSPARSKRRWLRLLDGSSSPTSGFHTDCFGYICTIFACVQTVTRKIKCKRICKSSNISIRNHIFNRPSASASLDTKKTTGTTNWRCLKGWSLGFCSLMDLGMSHMGVGLHILPRLQTKLWISDVVFKLSLSMRQIIKLPQHVYSTVFCEI